MHQTAAQLLGASREDLVGKNLWSSSQREESDGVFPKKYLEALAKNTPVSFQTFSLTTRKWLDARACPSSGRLLVYLRDISKEKKFQAITATLWKDYHSLADNAPDLIVRFNKDLYCTFVNGEFHRLFSATCVGKTHRELGLPRDAADRLEKMVKEVLRTRSVAETDFEIPTKEGSRFFSWRAAPVVGVDRKNASVLVIARDLTKQREEEQTRTKLAAAVEAAQEGMALAEPDGTVAYINAAFLAITGFEKAELVGQPLRILSRRTADPSVIRSVSGAMAGGSPWSGRFNARKNGGGEFLCDLQIAPIKNAQGGVTGFVGLIRDVTHEASLEEQIMEAQKLEAIGTLSGGIAHDFNNLLAVILGNTELALDDMEDDALTARNLKQVLTAAIRGRDLVKQILTFSRKSGRRTKAFNMTPLIKETAKLLHSTIPATVEIREELKAADETLNADPTQIQQVILNLTTNAAHAMAEGGVMTIGLSEVTLDSTNPLPDPALRPGDYLVLSVTDTGVGMDEKVKQKDLRALLHDEGSGTRLGPRPFRRLRHSQGS